MPDMLSQLPLRSKGPALEDNLVACLVRQIQPQGINFSDVQEQTGLDNVPEWSVTSFSLNGHTRQKFCRTCCSCTMSGMSWSGQKRCCYEVDD